jgi:hypothetical protein
MGVPSPSVLDVKQRAWRYWFADGLAHLLQGVAILSISICMVYQPRPGAFGQRALWLATFAFYGVQVFVQRPVLEWLKAKITYPRTGYAQSFLDAADMAGSPSIVELGLEGADERRAEAQRLVSAQRKQGW